MKKSSVIKNQESFFNLNSQVEKKSHSDSAAIFREYANKEQVSGFKWIQNSRKILEYGVGTGGSLDLFFQNRSKNKYEIYGVDIAGLAINKVKMKYPKFKFYKISNNKIPQIKNSSLDAIFMFHVLHHSHNHSQIFKEINLKLKKGGKFLINDLSSRSIFHKIGRSLFIQLPKSAQTRFNDDLVVDGNIPEKYPLNLNKIMSDLKKCNFDIKEVGYGHLFFFLLGWLDRFIPLSKIKIISTFYKQLIKIEKFLLRFSFFQKRAELIYIKCIKSS